MSAIFITVIDLEDIEVRVNVEKIQTLCEIDKELLDVTNPTARFPGEDAFTTYGKHVKICIDDNNWIRVKSDVTTIQRAIYHAQWDHQRDLATWWKAVPDA